MCPALFLKIGWNVGWNALSTFVEVRYTELSMKKFLWEEQEMRKSLKRWLIPMSAAMIALLSAGTALAADTVNVKVENTRGGYISVYYIDGMNNRWYLPIGENVEIPKGTELEYTARALNYTPNGNNDYNGVVIGVDEIIGSNVYEAEKWNQTRNSQRGTIVADSDMSIKGTFKAFSVKKADYEDDEDPYEPKYELRFKDEDDWGDNQIGKLHAGSFSEQLYLWDTENFKMYPFDSEIKAEITDVEGWDIDEDPIENLGICFSIDKNGKLTSSKELEEGEYRIRGNFEYKEENWDIDLTVELGAKVSIYMPMAYYQSCESSSEYDEVRNFITGYLVGDPNKITFNDTVVWANRSSHKLAGHEVVGIGERNNTTLKNIGTSKVSTKVSEKNPTAYVYAMYNNNYTAPIIEHLTKDDIIPETVNVGWNQISGEWYYYNSTSYRSLARNQWVPCRDKDGENVWVGTDGKVVTDAVVTDGADKYLVDAKGHKLCNKTGYTLGNVDYTTDENGKITGSKLHLATPSDAAKADQFVDDVMDNISSLTEEEQKKAADMVTESLKTKVDTSKMTEKDTKKYADFYREIYGSSNINVTGESSDENAMIVAAGLTSKDFEEDGSVEIELKSNWLATSSNAVKVELALYVNGKTRTFTAPVKVEVELPEAFVASYSNASYNFSISPKPVSYEIKDGKLIITIAKADVYTVQATKKSSGSSGSHSSSSGGSGRATVKAGYKASDGKTGNWVLDNKGWWFKYQDGTWPKSQWLELEWNNVKNWYYFGADGYMVTGWYQDGGKWYYLHPKADGTRGYMYTGWHQIGNNWYYFRVTAGGPKGSLVVNDTTPDGYKVNGNGEWVK